MPAAKPRHALLYYAGRLSLRVRFPVHVAGHNLGILMRLLIGAGTPREAAGRPLAYLLVVRNGLDRFHLVRDVIERVPQLGYTAAYVTQAMRDKLIEHEAYIRQRGQDMPEVSDWYQGLIYSCTLL